MVNMINSAASRAGPVNRRTPVFYFGLNAYFIHRHWVLFHLHHTEIYIHIPFEKSSRKYICCRPGKVEKKFEIYVQGAACSLENIYHIRFFQLVAYGVNYDSASEF